MKVELTRFKVKEGKSHRVDDWMNMLREHLPAVLKTLEQEKMYVETIFREELNGTEYLYWYSIQGENGLGVEKSEHEIDKKHIEFWKECIDSTVRGVDLKSEVVMIPDHIQKMMK